MTDADENGPRQSHYQEMTVAQVRNRPDADSLQIAFFESARFYRLAKGTSSFERISKILQEAKTTGRVVKVKLGTRDSGVIEDVRV
jgi:hypothetical protein